MSRQWQAVIVALALLGAWSAPAVAKEKEGKGHGRGHDKGNHARGKGPELPIRDRAVVIDRDGHRRVIAEYYDRESLPPGLAKRESLPPGLQKQLRERGHLPPGLQRRLIPVPAPLASRLPGIPPYYRRYFAGRDLIVVDPRTNTVVAIIPDAVARAR